MAKNSKRKKKQYDARMEKGKKNKRKKIPKQKY